MDTAFFSLMFFVHFPVRVRCPGLRQFFVLNLFGSIHGSINVIEGIGDR